MGGFELAKRFRFGANAIVARLPTPTSLVRELTLELGRLKETFPGSTAEELALAVRDGSRLGSDPVRRHHRRPERRKATGMHSVPIRQKQMRDV